MSFIIIQLLSTYYSLGVTISFCKFWFENDTLIQVRYCHLLGIWCFFIVNMLIASFLFILLDKIYVDIYLKIFGCILVFMFIPLAYQIWKTLKAISIERVSSKYRVEPERIKSNHNDILNWLSIVWNVTASF